MSVRSPVMAAERSNGEPNRRVDRALPMTDAEGPRTCESAQTICRSLHGRLRVHRRLAERARRHCSLLEPQPRRSRHPPGSCRSTGMITITTPTAKRVNAKPLPVCPEMSDKSGTTKAEEDATLNWASAPERRRAPRESRADSTKAPRSARPGPRDRQRPRSRDRPSRAAKDGFGRRG